MHLCRQLLIIRDARRNAAIACTETSGCTSRAFEDATTCLQHVCTAAHSEALHTCTTVHGASPLPALQTIAIGAQTGPTWDVLEQELTEVQPRGILEKDVVVMRDRQVV